MRSAEHGSNGFTLIELLVVLAIIGLVSGAVVLVMPDPRASLPREAERFAARVRAAQDEAVIGARATALRVTPGGYGFERRDHGRWIAITDAPLGGRLWPEGVRAQSSAPRATFDPTGLSDPLDVTLRREEDSVRVRIEGDGAVHVAQ